MQTGTTLCYLEKGLQISLPRAFLMAAKVKRGIKGVRDSADLAETQQSDHARRSSRTKRLRTGDVDSLLRRCTPVVTCTYHAPEVKILFQVIHGGVGCDTKSHEGARATIHPYIAIRPFLRPVHPMRQKNQPYTSHVLAKHPCILNHPHKQKKPLPAPAI